MNQPPDQNPYEQSERERRQNEMRELESLRLRQERDRLQAAKRNQVFQWIRNTIILLVGSLEILLVLRLFLRLTRANPENFFARFIFRLSDPFFAPFSTLFVRPADADNLRVLGLNLVFAMIMYALLGTLAIALLNYFQGRNPYGR